MLCLCSAVYCACVVGAGSVASGPRPGCGAAMLFAPQTRPRPAAEDHEENRPPLQTHPGQS